MPMKTHEIAERRSRLLDEARTLGAKPTPSTEETTRLHAIADDVEKLNREERTARVLEEAERRADAEPVTSGFHGDIAALESRIRVGKALTEFAEGKLTGAEAEYAAEKRSGRPGAIALPVSAFLGETRAVTTTTPSGGPGSNLVATQLGPLIDRLRPTLAVESMGATVLSGLSSNLDLPRLKASGSAGWVAEHGAATGTDAQFDKVSMGPKTVAAQYEMSRRMMIQATALETILRNDIGFLLRQALDSAAIKGGGSNEPTGILATSAVTVLSLGTNGAALSIDTPADMVGALDTADAAGPRGFLTNNKVKKAVMKMKDGQSLFYGMNTVFQGEPVTFSNQVPSNLTKGSASGVCSALLYGAWADLVIGYWSSVDVVLNPYADSVAGKGGALLHAFLDADVALRHPESFVVVKDILA